MVMKETIKYLAGIAGPSGFGSNSTADFVALHSSSPSSLHLTAIITGILFFSAFFGYSITAFA